MKKVPIPALLLQPIVENAIRHGIAPKKEGGEIVIQARKERDRCRIRISDTGVGFQEERSFNGFGLRSVRERLDICFFKASDKYVEGHTYDQSYLLNQTLNQLETELAEYDFVRIHRSALINLNHLEEMFRWFGGSFRVRMKDKARTELPLSRAARQKLGWT